MQRWVLCFSFVNQWIDLDNIILKYLDQFNLSAGHFVFNVMPECLSCFYVSLMTDVPLTTISLYLENWMLLPPKTLKRNITGQYLSHLVDQYDDLSNGLLS